jgi:hypothetical protein
MTYARLLSMHLKNWMEYTFPFLPELKLFLLCRIKLSYKTET